MKKMMLLLASLVALTACSQSKQDTKESTSNQTTKETKVSESSNKEEKGLKFVVAPQYEGKTSDLIELGKKLVKEHPELGSEGNMVLYFTGAISEGRAALMLVNKTDVDIKKDLNFSITWSYDGKTIFENQKVSYFIKDSGELPSHTATLILLPLNEEQMKIVDGMSDPSKMILRTVRYEYCRVIRKNESYKGEVNAPCLSYDWFCVFGIRNYWDSFADFTDDSLFIAIDGLLC